MASSTVECSSELWDLTGFPNLLPIAFAGDSGNWTFVNNCVCVAGTWEKLQFGELYGSSQQGELMEKDAHEIMSVKSVL